MVKWQDYYWKCHGIFFKKDSLFKELRYGDQLLIKSRLSELEPPKNPLEFNYKRFLGLDQIYHQQYVASGKWMKLDEEKG